MLFSGTSTALCYIIGHEYCWLAQMLNCGNVCGINVCKARPHIILILMTCCTILANLRYIRLEALMGF